VTLGAPPQIAGEPAVFGVENSDRLGVVLRQTADLDALDRLARPRLARIGRGSETARRVVALGQQRNRRRQLDRLIQGRGSGLQQALRLRSRLHLLRLGRRGHSGRNDKPGREAQGRLAEAAASEGKSHPGGFSLPESSAAGFPK
jgi:hypothetical protein